MNNIITLGEFVEILKQSDFFKERTDSETIVSAFFQSITDALKTDDTVSIKGFGDFAVISRDSGLVLFTPDRAMADTINEPFAFFEPIELTDVITDEMLDKVADETPTEENQPETTDTELSEPVETEKPVEKTHESVISVVEADDIPELPEVKDEQTEEKPVELQSEAIVEDKEPVKKEENTDDKVIEGEESVLNTAVNETEDEKTDSKETEDEDANEEEEEYEYTPAPRGHSTFALVAYTLLGIAIGFVIGLFTAEYIFADDEEDADDTEQIELFEEITTEETETLQNSIESAIDENAATQTEPTPEPGHETIVAQTPQAATKVITDTVRPNHYLTHMSRRFYGGATEFWVYIYLENQDKLGHPDRLQPNTVVVIPPAEKYGIDPNSQKSRDAAKQKVSEIYSKFK